jgi:hypothetical protein
VASNLIELRRLANIKSYVVGNPQFVIDQTPDRWLTITSNGNCYDFYDEDEEVLKADDVRLLESPCDVSSLCLSPRS